MLFLGEKNVARQKPTRFPVIKDMHERVKLGCLNLLGSVSNILYVYVELFLCLRACSFEDRSGCHTVETTDLKLISSETSLTTSTSTLPTHV